MIILQKSMGSLIIFEEQLKEFKENLNILRNFLVW